MSIWWFLYTNLFRFIILKQFNKWFFNSFNLAWSGLNIVFKSLIWFIKFIFIIFLLFLLFDIFITIFFTISTIAAFLQYINNNVTISLMKKIVLLMFYQQTVCSNRKIWNYCNNNSSCSLSKFCTKIVKYLFVLSKHNEISWLINSIYLLKHLKKRNI